MNTSKLEKAYLSVTPSTAGGLSKTELKCRFNPKEYTVDKSAEWKHTPAKGAKAPKMEFGGTKPSALKMELFFDAWESGSGDVSTEVETLFEWLNPTPKSVNGKKACPPTIVFRWGPKSLFDAHLKSVSAKYTMFRYDGVPVRATVAVTFEEALSEPGKQNPTSGAMGGKRVHVVAAGDSLHSIAYGEYDDPALWRGLAAANGIDDPLRLMPGTKLLVPMLEEVLALS